jgi:chromosome segregation protein
MLKLKRVDIHGFKSFYDRTDMKFHGSGIAAIVGPNGCGKSNISDAISWVLGEQSARSLRGTKMEDVIFAGTRERKPLGMAQVTLTMMGADATTLLPVEPTDTAPSDLPAAEAAVPTHTPPAHAFKDANADITITRRLYRSGESEYLVNGKSARLRDIQDLFSGTGLGPESYAIIEQGRIGQILSNKPADRRSIIEEAAGVGKYKTRKRLAEAKLESSRQNLSRVFDILEEVGRQVNSLKRQAAKAKRYEELRGEMIGHLRRAVAGRFRLLERDATSLSSHLEQAQASVQNLNASLQTQELEHTAVKAACYQTDAELTAARARVAELNVEAERTKGRLDSQAKQIGGFDERLAAGEAESQNLDARAQQEQADLAAHTARLAELEASSLEARQRLDAKTRERDQLLNGLRERERTIDQARQLVLRLVGEASTLRNQVVKIDEYLASMDRDGVRLRRDEDTAIADLARLDQVKEELSRKLSARQMELESLADRRKRVEADLAQHRTQIQTSRKQLDDTRAALARHKARRDSIDEILSHRSYTTESIKRLFTAVEKGRGGDFKPVGVLADYVEMRDPAWEKASETFLHEELEYIVVGNWEQAAQGVGLMRSEADGRATFLVHHAQSGISAVDQPQDAAIAGRLSDSLRLTNGFTDAPAGLLPRLANCFLVHEHADAQRLATSHQGCHFLLPDGTSYQGSSVTGGRKTGGGPLALKRELRELTGVVETHQRELDVVSGALAALEHTAARLAEEIEVIRTQQSTQEKDALAMDHEQRKLAEESARAGQRLSTARLELDRLGKVGDSSRAQRETSQAAVAEREQQRFEQEKVLESMRAELEGQQQRVHALNEEHSGLRSQLAGLEERQRSEKFSTQRIQEQLRQIGQRRDELGRALERMGTERARLLADNIELDQRAVALSEEKGAASTLVDQLHAAETAGRAALLALDESLRGLRIDSQKAQEKRGTIELELVKKQSDLRHLDETSRKELNEAASEIRLETAPVAEGEEGVVIELDEAGVVEAEELSATVRSRIEALGPVNPQALEEFQEATQRYEFLNTQRQDLLDGIRDTEKAIQELEVESRRRFKEAFDIINEHFKGMFKTLFGGGQGEMRLTDEANVNESGIDILASPPGKKLQNIALLSGGEKSLTAMALLMAIFRYTPSPFCILDEVDAPLDEANIQRLARLIKEMSEETQFIVITHAKRTMEMAQALYGVTMQEPGLSTLVSVRFDQPVVAPEPAALAVAAAS